MNIRARLNQQITDAMRACGLGVDCSAQLVASSKFGDYQANGIMGASKRLGLNPRDKAQEVVNWAQQQANAGCYENLEVAGPGFVNVTLKSQWLAEQLHQMSCSERLGVDTTEDRKVVVVDYSSPNLAKEMHVGHLRSTVIGDSVARILDFLGHQVIRQNHMGDWGTQFGMLIAELEQQKQSGSIELADLEQFYRQAKEHFDGDAEFADLARDYVVKLQSNDPHCLELWQQFIDISVEHSEQIYRQLNVTLNRQHIMAESAYNKDLQNTVSQLQDQGLAVVDRGATVIFLPEFKNREGEMAGIIIQKADGGYLYTTTDLAALQYRLNTLKADRLLYFIDARQSLHMQQLFAMGKAAGWVSSDHELHHHAFGTIMDKSGKPFKTRSGETIKLADLLTEAQERAAELVSQKSDSLSDEQKQEIGRKVGIGAIKYADLSKTRTNDYVFDWEQMLSFEGNTAPYLQYAYTRIISLLAKADMRIDGDSTDFQDWLFEEPVERQLALHLLRFSEVLEQVGDNAFPHELCNYLFDLSALLMRFYENCPVLSAQAPLQQSRIHFCILTAKVLAKGLELLGIDVMDRM